MIVYVPIINAFEQSVGTFYTLYSVAFLLVLIISLIHTGIAYALDAIFHRDFILNGCGGMSAIVFAAFIFNAHKSEQRQVSIFGLFKVPIIWFPPLIWLILLFATPHLNPIYNAAGIICGHLLIGGRLEALIPAADTLRDIEKRLGLPRLPAWKPIPSSLGRLLEGEADTYGAA